jgi:hypothetical protein
MSGERRSHLVLLVHVVEGLNMITDTSGNVHGYCQTLQRRKEVEVQRARERE